MLSKTQRKAPKKRMWKISKYFLRRKRQKAKNDLDVYQNISEEEKDKKHQYQRERNKNLSEKQKKKKVEYMRN